MPTDSRLRILLVEDNEGDAALVDEYVADAGKGQFVLRRAQTLAEGHAILAEFDPQIILLDLNLPDSKGLDTVENFCAVGTAERPRPPIIVLTSFDDQEMAERAISGCAQDYLVKNDVNSRTLLRSIRFAIQRHGKAEMDKMLKDPDGTDGNQREALQVLQRVNRTAPGEVGGTRQGLTGGAAARADDPRVTSSLLLEHFTTGQRATEVIVTGLDQRVRKLEKAEQNYYVAEARRELLWVQLERLIIGNGKGPLATRLETIERAVAASLDDRKERRGNLSQWRVAVAVLVLGWVGSLLVWAISYLARLSS